MPCLAEYSEYDYGEKPQLSSPQKRRKPYNNNHDYSYHQPRQRLPSTDDEISIHSSSSSPLPARSCTRSRACSSGLKNNKSKKGGDSTSPSCSCDCCENARDGWCRVQTQTQTQCAQHENECTCTCSSATTSSSDSDTDSDTDEYGTSRGRRKQKHRRTTPTTTNTNTNDTTLHENYDHETFLPFHSSSVYSSSSDTDTVFHGINNFCIDSMNFDFGNLPRDDDNTNTNITLDNFSAAGGGGDLMSITNNVSFQINNHIELSTSTSTRPVRSQQELDEDRRLLTCPKDKCGNTELHLQIIAKGETEALKLIRRATDFDDLNVSNKLGQTPMHLAVIHRQAAILRKLICAGGLVSALDNAGNTPLHLASAEGRTDLAEHLLTPIYYEETLENTYTIPVQAIPQDLNVKNGDGFTCLKLADQNYHTDLGDILFENMA